MIRMKLYNKSLGDIFRVAHDASYNSLFQVIIRRQAKDDSLWPRRAPHRFSLLRKQMPCFCAFTDGKCEILDTLLCVKKAVQKPKRRCRCSRSLARKSTQGDHCAQISYRKIACAVVCPSQTTRQLASATYSQDGVICIWPRAIQLATKCKN